MILIIGLGNPGEKYAKTWHNIGFLTIDKFKEENNFPDFEVSKKFKSLISDAFLKREKIILSKPETFMNNSGEAVRLLTKFFKPNQLIVIHDEIDIPLGEIKISKNRGPAGHKGVMSIIKEIGSQDFIRIRIGVKPKNEIKEVEKFVLKKIGRKEEKIVSRSLKTAIEAIKLILDKGLEESMNRYN